MLRSLLVVIVPIASLLANVATFDKHALQGAQNQLDLADVPVPPDPVQEDNASELAQVRMAAENGDLDAQARLGVMYYWGQGAPKDYDQAQLWLRKASKRGHRDAQAKLGAMCFLGQGGPADVNEAIMWFRKAADQGEPYAQGCIGVMYAVGQGLPRDLVEAYVWLYQAQVGGDADAAEPLHQITSHLSPTQLQEGIRRAQQAIRSRENAK